MPQSELWKQVFNDSSSQVGAVTPEEQWNRWEESGPGSQGSTEMVVQDSGEGMRQRQEQTMNELRDMEFEVVGRLEAERALREKHLQIMSQQSEKLNSHGVMLEKVLVQQRVLNQIMQKVSAQQEHGFRHVARSSEVDSSSPAQPVALPPQQSPTEPPAPGKVEAPVVEALRKLETKVHEMHKAVVKSTIEPAPSTSEKEAPEIVVEFGGLWYEGKSKHVISGKYLHDAAGAKSELVIYNQREFTVNGAAMGHAHVAKDGMSLVWSSGRVWTRTAANKRENLQARLSKIKTQGTVRRPSGSQDAENVVTEEDHAVARTYAMPWSKNVTLPEELTEIRSIFGDSLRDHSLRFDGNSMMCKFLLTFASFADWMEVQHRAPMPQHTRLDRAVQSIYFEVISAFLIMANAVYIGYTTNWFMQNPLEENTPLMTLLDLFFTALFTLELGLRACSLRNMFFFGPDAIWYSFDVLLIAISVGELLAGSSGTFSFLRTLRVFKLARVIRMVRTLRLFNELRLLLDCMIGSLNSLFWCLLVIAFVFYLFALILVQGLAGVLGDIERELDTFGELSNSQLQREAIGEEIKARWGSVSKAMLRLWYATTGGVDWEVEYNLVSTAGVFHSAVFIAFIAFMLIVVWNIVTSTILEKALRFAQPDIDQLLMDKRRRDNEDVEILLAMLKKAGIEVTQKITEEEFMLLLGQKDMADFLQVRGIDIKEAHSFFALINEDASLEGVDTTSFIAMCLRIKGVATSIDLHTIHYQTMGILKRQGKLLTDTIRSMHDLSSTVRLQRQESLASASETSEFLSTVLGQTTTAEGSNEPRAPSQND